MVSRFSRVCALCCPFLAMQSVIYNNQPTNAHKHLHIHHHHHNHNHHVSVMELGHLLTRSSLTYPEVSSKVCHDSFCQLGNSVYTFIVILEEQNSYMLQTLQAHHQGINQFPSYKTHIIINHLKSNQVCFTRNSLMYSLMMSL